MLCNRVFQLSLEENDAAPMSVLWSPDSRGYSEIEGASSIDSDITLGKSSSDAEDPPPSEVTPQAASTSRDIKAEDKRSPRPTSSSVAKDTQAEGQRPPCPKSRRVAKMLVKAGLCCPCCFRLQHECERRKWSDVSQQPRPGHLMFLSHCHPQQLSIPCTPRFCPA